jgi:predicted aldo/keto reductase-like oxidoreductase
MPAALKWVFRNKDVDTAIVGIVDNDQLEANFNTMSAPFEAADQKLLVAQLERIGPLYCRMCGSCAGKCAKGLPVADILRTLTYADGYGQFALARDSFLALGPQERCADCGTCAIQCPNGVRVADRIRRAQDWLA